MTHPTTRTEAEQVLAALMKTVSDQSWYKRAQIMSDDNGYGIDLFVDGPKYREAGAKAGGTIDRVKVCVLLVG